jgi:hypothetical protein
VNKHRPSLSSRPRIRHRARRPGGPPEDVAWVWLPLDLIASPAWRALLKYNTAAAVVFRILVEHLHHAGKANGSLKVTYRDFEEFGAHPRLIPDGIAIAEALGIIKVTKRGRASYAEKRSPSQYAYAWNDIDGVPATNDWRRVTNDTHARVIVTEAMKRRKAERAERYARGQSKKPTQFVAAGGRAA